MRFSAEKRETRTRTKIEIGWITSFVLNGMTPLCLGHQVPGLVCRIQDRNQEPLNISSIIVNNGAEITLGVLVTPKWIVIDIHIETRLWYN